MQAHPASWVVYSPPIEPDGGACSTVLLDEVQSVKGPAVISMNLVLAFFVNVPIALNATVPPVGTLPGAMVVLVAAGRGVNVGVGILGVAVGFGVGLGVLDEEAVAVAVAVGVNVGEGGGPFAIVMASSEMPGALVAVGPPPLLPPQLRRIAPKTNSTTGVTTRHLSHRDNIKPTPMTDAAERCQVDARFRPLTTAAERLATSH